MKCMYCGYTESKVVDSRSADDGNSIRRRRECLKCGKRFTTYETIENTPVLVIKNDGTRQPFDTAKIRNGIIKSCEKRPVAMQKGLQHARTRNTVLSHWRVCNGRLEGAGPGCIHKVRLRVPTVP